MVLHADNTIMLVKVRDTGVLKLKIASTVKQLESWFLKNELILNMAKTCVMSLHSSQCRYPYKPHICYNNNNKLNSMALVRERTIPTERPPPVGEVSANFCG